MRKNSIVWPRDIADDPVSLVLRRSRRYVETTNRPSRPDRLEIFCHDWGDRDGHMETRLQGYVYIACATDEIKPLVWSVCEIEPKSLYWAPHLCTRIWVRAMIGLLKKNHCRFTIIYQSGWSEIRNVFPVICRVRWWPGTRISVLLRKRYQPGFWRGLL